MYLNVEGSSHKKQKNGVTNNFFFCVIKSAGETAKKVLLSAIWNLLLIEMNLSQISTLDIKREKVCTICPYLLLIDRFTHCLCEENNYWIKQWGVSDSLHWWSFYLQDEQASSCTVGVHNCPELVSDVIDALLFKADHVDVTNMATSTPSHKNKCLKKTLNFRKCIWVVTLS